MPFYQPDAVVQFSSQIKNPDYTSNIRRNFHTCAKDSSSGVHMSKPKRSFENQINEFDDNVFADDYDYRASDNDLDDLIKSTDELTPDSEIENVDDKELDTLLSMVAAPESEEIDELLEEAMQTSFYFDSQHFPRDDHPLLYKLLDKHGDEIYQSILDHKDLHALYRTDHSILSKHLDHQLKKIYQSRTKEELKVNLSELGIHNIDDNTIKQIRAENTAYVSKGKKKRHVGLFEHKKPNDDHQTVGHHTGAKKRR